MNRRAFLGSGLMSLFVGVFAVLMGGGLPRPKQREGKAVTLDNSPLSAKDQAWVDSLDLTAAEAELGITPVPDHLRILKPWDGKTIQEADYCGPIHHYRLGQQGDILPALSRIPTNEEASEIAATLAALNGRAVSWDAPAKPTPLADMRRIHAPGRQFGLG